MYKSLFEMSPDRSDFVSRLFSRRRPAGLTATTPVKTLFDAYNSVRADPQLYSETLQAIRDRLLKQHQFTISRADDRTMEYVFNVFYRGGPRMDYTYASASPNNLVPSYYNLMVSTDRRGQNWAYLASEDNYQRIRQMQQKNLIVPIVGDFAGPKAIKSVAKYLKDHGAVVTVFYISNVEDYLATSWPNYAANIAALPTDPRSSVFIRFVPRTITTLRLIKDLPSRWPGRNW
jgi:hypothetical protein